MHSANSEPLRVAAYCRVSTEKEDQLNSLEVQKEFFQSYAQEHHYELVKVYADEGISGTKLKNRKAFNQMMADAQLDLFQCVFVKDISRFSRNTVDFLSSIRTLKAKGIGCRFVNSNLDTGDGEFILGILAMVAQEESANLSKRVKFGKKKNAEKGKVPNFVYGYDKIDGQLFDLKINSMEAAVIQQIFQLYLSGFGVMKIAEILNQEGKKTKRNRPWSQNAVSRILQNRLYIGEITNGKEAVNDFLTGKRTKIHPDQWMVTKRLDLAIIEERIFQKAQEILEKNKQIYQTNKRHSRNQYIFSTLIECQCCGRSFTRIHKKFATKDYIKWSCCGRNSGKSFCNNHTLIDERELVHALFDYLKSNITNTDKFAEKVFREFQKLCPSKTEREEAALQKEMESLKKQKEKQITLYEEDIITLEELKERSEKLSMRLHLYQKKWDMLPSNNQAFLSEKVKSYCQDFDLLYSENILGNIFLKKIIEKITVTENQEINIMIKNL